MFQIWMQEAHAHAHTHKSVVKPLFNIKPGDSPRCLRLLSVMHINNINSSVWSGQLESEWEGSQGVSFPNFQFSELLLIS